MNNIKQEFYLSMNEWLKGKRNEYDLYFTTYTFNESNQQIKANAKIWFERHIQRLNNQLLSNGKHHEHSAILILYPETDAHFNRLHYHGILLIHKSTKKRFFERVFNGSSSVEPINKRKIKAKNKITKFYTLFSDKVMQPFMKFESGYTRKLMKIFHKPKKKQEPAPLTVKSYRFYILQTNDDIEQSYRYSQKHFDSVKFDIDDIMVFKKLPDSKNDKLFALKRHAHAAPTKRNIKRYKYVHENYTQKSHINQIEPRNHQPNSRTN